MVSAARRRVTCEEDQSDIQAEAETRNQMDMARDEEEQDEESFSKRRPRRSSRPPPAPSQKAARVAGSVGLASTFFSRRRGGGSANAQSAGKEKTNSLTSEGDFLISQHCMGCVSFADGSKMDVEATHEKSYSMYGQLSADVKSLLPKLPQRRKLQTSSPRRNQCKQKVSKDQRELPKSKVLPSDVAYNQVGQCVSSV